MSWTHLEDSTPKARKRYQCYLCENMIEVGEQHVKRSGVDGDGLTSFRIHSSRQAKTAGWDEDCWDHHDAAEFRRYELNQGSEVNAS